MSIYSFPITDIQDIFIVGLRHLYMLLIIYFHLLQRAHDSSRITLDNILNIEFVYLDEMLHEANEFIMENLQIFL